MSLFKCERCGYTSKYKSNLKNHLNRKRICKPVLSNRSIEELKLLFNEKYKINEKSGPKRTQKWTQMDPKVDPNGPKWTQMDPKMDPSGPKNIKNIYKCKYCEKIYSNNSHMNRHMKKCKYREDIDSSELSRDGLLKYIDIIKSDRDRLRKQIEDLMFQVSKGNRINNRINNSITNGNYDNSNNKTLNTQNNNSHNINNNNIYINNFGEENKEYITPEYLTELLKIPYSAIQKLIKNIHFNPLHPENHNIKIPNRKEKFAIVYKNGDWKLRNKHNVIDDMVENGYNMLDCHFDDEGKLVLEDVKRKRFIHFQEDFENTKGNCHKKVENDTEMLVLNN